MMMTTANEVNSDKTKVLNELIFRSAPLFRFTAELDESIDSQSIYIYRGYYTVARRYKFYVRGARTPISHECFDRN